MELILTEHIYPDTPCAEIGKFFKEDDKYYHQRKSDVLFINPDGLITTHSVGFLENCDYPECTKKEFSDVLNTTIFNMNILNGDFK